MSDNEKLAREIAFGYDAREDSNRWEVSYRAALEALEHQQATITEQEKRIAELEGALRLIAEDAPEVDAAYIAEQALNQ